MDFTDAQREAIAYRGGHLQILACAGSGKTEVVARRIADLLDPQRPDPLVPRNIVPFIDFTFRAGAIKVKPDSWKDLFFPVAHGWQGS